MPNFIALLQPLSWVNADVIPADTGFDSADLGGGILGAYAFFICGAGTPKIEGYAFDSACFGGVVPCTQATLPVNADPPFPPVWPYPTGLTYSRENYSLNLRMVRGDTYIFDSAVVLNGEAVDITGCSFRVTAKYSYTEDDAEAVFIKTSNPVDGITILSAPDGSLRTQLAPADTNGLPSHQVDLVYDLQMLDATGNVFTLQRGILTVVPDVSLTT